MSGGDSTKGSNSESSSSSPNQLAFFQTDSKEYTDLTLVGCPAPTLCRTGTVRRASAGTSGLVRKEAEDVDRILKNEKTAEKVDSKGEVKTEKLTGSPERYRKSLDSTYRHSLESISEYKTKSSFSSTSLFPSRECSSMESSSSDCTDYAVRSMTETTKEKEDKTIMSPSSSYITWIESVNSEYFGSAVSTAEMSDVDNKVGEWNNFWLNYNSARSRYLSSPYLTSNEDRTGDEMSEVKSTCSTHRDITDRISSDSISLTLEEANEAMKCSQRVVDILQNAMKRSDHEFDDTNNDSYYSQNFSQQTSVKDDYRDMVAGAQRERSFSYVVDATDLQKQRQLFKPAAQSSSTSCINALLNTGVADILKRVITKRRDIVTSDDFPSLARNSFSEWSSTK